LIKTLKISSYYPAHLKKLWQQLTPRSYPQAYQAIMGSHFGSGALFKEVLEASGSFSVFEVVSNDPVSQRLWFRETMGSNPRVSRHEVLLAQTRWFQPKVVFLMDHDLLKEKFAQEIRKLIPGVFLVGYNGLGVPETKIFEALDLVLTPLSHIERKFQKAGLRTLRFRPGFPRKMADLPVRPRTIPTAFCGSVSISEETHGPRLRFLANLCREVRVDLFLHGLPSWRPFSLAQIKRRLGGRRQLADHLAMLGSKNHGEVFGAKMFETLATVQTLLNHHVATAQGESVNMRLYEGTGMGCCVLTEDTEDLRNKFEVDREILTYRTESEALEKIRYLREHPSVAAEIGQRGRCRTLGEYCMDDEIANFGKKIESLL